MSVLIMAAAGLAWGQPSVRPESPAAAWRFVGECVSIELSQAGFTVQAEYQFRLAADATALVFQYPFPVDSSLGEPELLEASISGASGWRALHVSPGDGCWRWIAEPSDTGQCAIRVAYRQATTSGRARYVLTSTQIWGRTIDHARLEVRIPRNRRCRIVPALPLISHDGEQTVYRGEFLRFLPQGDLLVELLEDN